MTESLCNAGAELREALEGNLKLVQCLDITVQGTVLFFRRDLHRDFDQLLEELDSIEYDDGFGCQELFGTIWLTDGTWLSRGEHDGSEWWERNERPEIPDKSRWSS